MPTTPITEIQSNSQFLTQATIARHNLQTLNQTRIRFKIGLKKVSRRTAPKWQQVLSSSQTEQKESDLEKITKSEVGLRGISVFKALDEAASELRCEIEAVKEWMTSDNGDWVCSLKLAPLVWQRILYLRDTLVPTLRENLKGQYDKGYTEFEQRLEEFLSAQAWNLDSEKRTVAKEELLKQFPLLEELEDYLQIIIGRPVIIPALSEQMSEQQAECLNQITQFIENYDRNLEETLKQAAIAGGEQLAAELLSQLADWEPGRKPIQFRKKLEKHLQKIQVLLGNASEQAGVTLGNLMEHLEEIIKTTSVNTKQLSQSGKSQLQEQIDKLREQLLGEQQELRSLAEGMGLTKATAMTFKFR